MIELVQFFRAEKTARFENDKGQVFDVNFEDWERLKMMYGYFVIDKTNIKVVEKIG